MDNSSQHSGAGATHLTEKTDPFGDSAVQSHNVTPHDPFQSPAVSRPPSSFANSYPGNGASATGRMPVVAPRYFHSRRVNKDDIAKPWLSKKDPKEKWVTILPVIGVVLGLGISGKSKTLQCCGPMPM